MIRHIDAVFSNGAFLPVKPLALPEGTRVLLSIEEQSADNKLQPVAKIRSPKLVHPEDAADFVMDVRESGNAGV